MAKLEVTKTIEARKLNPRSRLALAEPPVTIPYGAILDEVVEKGDNLEFIYLRELYSCKAEVLRPASHAMSAADPAPAKTAAAAAPAPAPAPSFVWEPLHSGAIATSRAKVPGGWLIAANGGVAFYPDSGHAWDGKTIA